MLTAAFGPDVPFSLLALLGAAVMVTLVYLTVLGNIAVLAMIRGRLPGVESPLRRASESSVPFLRWLGANDYARYGMIVGAVGLPVAVIVREGARSLLGADPAERADMLVGALFNGAGVLWFTGLWGLVVFEWSRRARIVPPAGHGETEAPA